MLLYFLDSGVFHRPSYLEARNFLIDVKITDQKNKNYAVI